MQTKYSLRVAVLLATYNGAQHLDEQIQSLRDNHCNFTLHWLDDHSGDNSREVVRTSAKRAGIALQEWHQLTHVGIPDSFFLLLDCVDADVYLFCDQDDIWQPAKIDAAVESLSHDLATPTLCYSDSIWFGASLPRQFRRTSEIAKFRAADSDWELRHTLFGGCFGAHAQAFNRSLREVYLRFSSTAKEYAFMHDWWLHHLALMCGRIEFLWGAPAALFRQHDTSYCQKYFNRANKAGVIWPSIRRIRLVLARHARGLDIVAASLPPNQHVEKIVRFARIVSNLDKRHSLREFIKLLRSKAFILPPHAWAWWMTAMLTSTATSSSLETTQIRCR